VVGWWEGVLQYDKAEYKDKGTRTKVKGRGLEVKGQGNIGILEYWNDGKKKMLRDTS